MGFFKNKYNELWAGWKIAIVLAVFLISSIILGIIISIAYGVFAVLTSGETDPVVLAQRMMNNGVLTSLSGILQNVVVISSVLLFWRIFDKKPLKEMGLSSLKHGSRDLISGLILGAVSISVIFAVFLLSGQISVANDFLKPNFSWALLLDLVLMIFVGFGEEMFSRGYCMSVLKRSNIILIFIVPNLIFGLLHISNSNFGFIPLINIFLIGTLFSLMFIRRGNIWMPIGYHITWNYFQGSVFGLPVSGNDIRGIYTSKLLSENIFNGGGFGPEGGLLVTILIIVSIVIFYLFTRKKEASSTADLPM